MMTGRRSRRVVLQCGTATLWPAVLGFFLCAFGFVATARGQNPPFRTVVFDSTQTGSSEIYLLHLDVNNVPLVDANNVPLGPVKLTNAGAGQQEAQEPRWSLAASAGIDAFGRIVYQFGVSNPGINSSTGGAARGLHIMKPLPPGTNGDMPLTPQPLNGKITGGPLKGKLYPCTDARDPSWSPDGTLIVYACLEQQSTLAALLGGTSSNNGTNPTSYDLWIHDTNGTPDDPSDDSDYPLLTLNGRLALRPVWSPDQTMIAYVTNAPGNSVKGPTSKIGLIGVPGNIGTKLNVQQSGQILTDDLYNDIAPTWSPDGQSIAFSTTRTGNRTIWRMSILGESDSPNFRQVTNGSSSRSNDTNPAWSSSGPIAFTSGRSNGNHIYAVDPHQSEVSGGTPSQLSAGLGNDDNAGWKPGQMGIDISQVSPIWSQIKQAGINVVMHKAYGGCDESSLAAANLSGAQQAGLITGAHVLLNFTLPSFPGTNFVNCDPTENGATQVAYGLDAINGDTGNPLPLDHAVAIGPALQQLRVLVLDIEAIEGAPKNETFPSDVTSIGQRVQRIQEAVDAVRQFNVVYKTNLHVAIYSDRNSWQKITGGTGNFVSLPLWDTTSGYQYTVASTGMSHCGDGLANLDINTFTGNSFAPYPINAWSTRQGKQFDLGPSGGSLDCSGAQSATFFGLGLADVDMDVFSPEMFSVDPSSSLAAAGNNVVNQPADIASGTSPVSLTFSAVSQAGLTTLMTTSSGPNVPAGFKLGSPPTYFNVTTTAAFVPPIRICINYSDVSYGSLSDLHLLHFDQTLDQSGNQVGWVDLTDPTRFGFTNDTVAKIICANVGSLSPFIVVEPLPPPSNPILIVAGGTFIYDGTAHGATANATGLSGAPVSGSLTFTYAPGGSAPPVNVGTYSVTAQFTSSDPNYTNASSTGTITITPAPTQTPTTGATGSMQFARVSHQATLLADGLVLVSGGQSGGTAIAQSELYNPATGTWSLTGSNVIPRFDHTATLLQDGRVLAAGGVSSNGDCSSNVTAETYDPAKETWSLTGRLPSPVGTGHIAVRLLDGRVLVSGGGDRCGTVFNTAAIFDPSTNKWSGTGNMTAAREFYSAALLPDGRVLVAGGVTSSPFPAVASAEIYDPVAGAWTAVASMGTARQTSCNGYAQTYLAALSGGTVLAAGGFSGPNCYSITPKRSVVSLTVNPSPALLSNVGQTQALTVTAQMSDGSTQPFTGPLQFSSADTTIAKVDSNGLITSVGAGTTTITVTASGIAPVGVTTTVASRSLTSIIVSPASITLIGSGQTQPLTVNGQFSDGSQQALTTGVTFVSSNPAVASVDQNGLVTSGANGTATITASAQGAPAVQVAITVKSLVSIVVSPTSITLTAIGPVQALTVTGQFSDGSQQILTSSVSFISSNPSVARVDLSGSVTAISIGTATITVSLPNVAAVQVPVTIAPTPVLLSVSPNSGQQGQQNLSVSLTGQFTHWVQGTTVVGFGPGINVASLTVNSATSATAVLNIDPGAVPGPRTITLTTGTEVATLANGFTIVAPTPVLVSVNPPTGQLGQQNLSVSLTGQFTHWVQATTTASFGGGITVSSLTVSSPTSATAVLTVDPGTTTGPRTVSLTTGSEVESLANGFVVSGGPGEADAKPFSVLNLAGVTGGKPIALEADAKTFSVLNTSGAGGTGGRQSSEVDATDFSILNLAGITGGKPVPMEADAVPFSLLNTAGPGGSGGRPTLFEVDALPFSFLNLAGVSGNQPVKMEADGVPFSVKNGP